MSAGGGAAGGGHPDYGVNAPNYGGPAPSTDSFSGALGSVNAALANSYGLSMAALAQLGLIDTQTHTFDPDIAKALGKKTANPHTEMGFTSPAMQGKRDQEDALREAIHKGKISQHEYDNRWGPLINHVNPVTGQLEYDEFGNIKSYTEKTLHGAPGKESVKAIFGPTIESQDPNYAPSIEMINPVNTTPTAPVRAAPTATEDLMNEVLGLDLSQMDQDVLGLDRAMVSRDIDPWGANRSVISNISHSDTEREYAERAAAERALYSQIANQITQAAGQSGGGTTVAGPTGGSTGGGTTGGGNTGGGTTGGGSTGGGTTGGGTTGGGPKPKPPRGGRQDPPPRKPDPINILVKTLLTPKKQMRGLAKHAQESLRQGRMPDFSMLPDFQQDLVRDILNPPKPVDMSNPENRGI